MNFHDKAELTHTLSKMCLALASMYEVLAAHDYKKLPGKYVDFYEATENLSQAVGEVADMASIERP